MYPWYNNLDFIERLLIVAAVLATALLIASVTYTSKVQQEINDDEPRQNAHVSTDRDYGDSAA